MIWDQGSYSRKKTNGGKKEIKKLKYGTLYKKEKTATTL